MTILDLARADFLPQHLAVAELERESEREAQRRQDRQQDQQSQHAGLWRALAVTAASIVPGV